MQICFLIILITQKCIFVLFILLSFWIHCYSSVVYPHYNIQSSSSCVNPKIYLKKEISFSFFFCVRFRNVLSLIKAYDWEVQLIWTQLLYQICTIVAFHLSLKEEKNSYFKVIKFDFKCRQYKIKTSFYCFRSNVLQWYKCTCIMIFSVSCNEI